MKVVLQRVKRAAVKVFDDKVPAGRTTGEIGRGLVLLIGLKADDETKACARLARKVAELRIFEDDDGKMNRSVRDIGGAILAVSQFTLYGDTSKGRRPSFTGTMPPAEAEQMYERFVKLLREDGFAVATGEFGAKMEVEIINDGPVTFVLEE